jgi:DNA invertase Pin-like site-specific DNA recombinase
MSACQCTLTAMDRPTITHLAAGASGDDPFSALASVRDLRRELDRTEELAARRARNAGASWQEIATLLGVSRQAVHKKYGRD